MGHWLRTPPGRYLLEWEQACLDGLVSDVFGYHALQLGLAELDGLRANRMPHRWVATDTQHLPEPIERPALEDGISRVSLHGEVALHCDFDALLRESGFEVAGQSLANRSGGAGYMAHWFATRA